MGDILQNQREQSGQTDLLSAAGLAIPYAAANVFGVEGALARGQLFRNTVGALDNMNGVRGGLSRAGVTVGRTALTEGASETFQEGMNQFGRMAVDPSETFFNPQSNERFVESFVGGATLGGITGGVAGGWRRSQQWVDSHQPIHVLPDAAPPPGQYTPPDSLTNTPVTELPGFASRPQDPLQEILNPPPPGPSVTINPNAPAERAVANGTATPQQTKAAQVTPEERQAAGEKYRMETVLDDGTEEGHWRLFGRDFFKRADLNKALDRQAIEDRNVDAGLSSFAKELNYATTPIQRPQVLNELARTLYGSTPEKTAYNLNAAIAGGHKEAERLAATYEKLTGQESPAWKAAKEQPAKPAPAPKPVAAPDAPAAPAAPQTFEEDDFDGMARATLLKLFNGNERSAEIALADLRGDKVADITKAYGVSDSLVRKLRDAYTAPKRLELAARQAGVPLEKLAAALAKKDELAKLQGKADDVQLAEDESVDKEVQTSDDRQLAQVADEELTAEQTEHDVFETAGMTVRTASGSQIADVGERNISRSKFEKAKQNLQSRSLTLADLNNLYEEFINEESDAGDALAQKVVAEVERRHKYKLFDDVEQSEVDKTVNEGKGKKHETRNAVLPAGQEDAGAPARKGSAAPAAGKTDGAKKPEGPLGHEEVAFAWNKMSSQVEKAGLKLPKWDELSPEQRTKATDKYVLNGKLDMREAQKVLSAKEVGGLPPKRTPGQMDSRVVRAITDQVKRQGSNDTDENAAQAETIKAKPGADLKRMAKMLGAKLYGNPGDIGQVSVKEMLQNSYDGIKDLIAKGTIKKGLIDIKVSNSDRTVRVLDNGVGMSSRILGTKFLEIAGTHKESDRSSGGFGIAKMLFLYGNDELHVITMKDGVVSELRTRGTDLFEAMDDQSKAPNIQTRTPNAEDRKRFPDGHGTYVEVKIPKSYVDPSSGESKDIHVPDSMYYHDSLKNSPLFDNIEVRFNDSQLSIGSGFPYNDFTQFANVNFEWGTARIYVGKNKKNMYNKNTHILSNGLWQFSMKLSKNPMDIWGDAIPREFYIDVSPKVRPEDAGYPFELSRQEFAKQAKEDFGKIFKYITTLYQQMDFADSVKNFGTFHYLKKFGNGKIISSPDQLMQPPVPERPTAANAIQEGDQVEVKDGRLIVNGRAIPELTEKDLKNAQLSIDELVIPQHTIHTDEVMIHDNMELDVGGVAEKKARLKEISKELDAQYNTPYDKRDRSLMRKLQDEETKITEEISNGAGKYAPTIKVLKDRFGEERTNQFLYGIGDTFKQLRDLTATVMGYAELKNEAVGISFDTEYRGVSTRVPFRGMFLNPAAPESIVGNEAAYGMFGTMIHELAHFKVRSHNADFPAEMQRITFRLKGDAYGQMFGLEQALVEHLAQHRDIIEFLHGQLIQTGAAKPRGQRFNDGGNEAIEPADARSPGVLNSMGSVRGAARPGLSAASRSSQEGQNTGRVHAPGEQQRVVKVGELEGTTSSVSASREAQAPLIELRKRESVLKSLLNCLG